MNIVVPIILLASLAVNAADAGDACVEVDMWHYIKPYSMVETDNAEACRILCLAATDCTGWSWYTKNWKCFYGTATTLHDGPKAKSGVTIGYNPCSEASTTIPTTPTEEPTTVIPVLLVGDRCKKNPAHKDYVPCTPYSVCRASVCKCDKASGYMYSRDEKACVAQDSVELGEHCEIRNLRCRDPGSMCLAFKCKCNPALGFTNVAGVCEPPASASTVEPTK